jgi:(heptosyl)LPS beta-1,4-glucosyltransferase
LDKNFNITSIVIAKDEESNIKRCIESQLGCIDEIIILVDDKTSDNTFEVAKEYIGVKAEVVKWQGYSETKKYAVSLANNNWIFWIDADEAITDGLRKEIINFKNSKPEFSAYSVSRKAYFLGRWIKHSGWYPGRVNRLFDKTKVQFSDNEVHEYLIIDDPIGKLKSDLDHFTDPTIEHYFEKFNNYTTLAAEEMVKRGKNYSLINIILRPPLLFIKMYFLKLGFLDGIEGFILASFSSSYVFTKYCKFWWRKKHR